MKKIIFAIILCVSSISLSAQTPHAQTALVQHFNSEELKVNEAIINFFDALSELDAAKLQRQTTKDFTLLEDGQVWNADSLVRYFEPMKKMNIKRVNKFNFIKTVITNNTAWTAYYNRADMQMGEKQLAKDWLESAVLAREGGIWKVKVLHSTVIKPKGK